MAVTVTSITPTTTASAGKSVVEIIGTGFRLPTPAPATSTGPLPPPAPSVRVYFGTELAGRVRVISTTRLLVTTPSVDPGLVAVRVVNIDDFGAPLEEGTLVAAITFRLPDLVTQKSDLSRIVRTIIRELKKQIVPNVVLSVAVDWDDTPGLAIRETGLATVPGLSLAGPSIRRSDATMMQTSPTYTEVTAGASESRTPKTRDLVFSIVAIADKYNTTLNLVQAVESFFVHNTTLYVLRDPDLPEAGYVEYELVLEEDLVIDSSPNPESIYSGSGSFVIKAVDILGMPGIDGDLVTDLHPPVTEDVTINSFPK